MQYNFKKKNYILLAITEFSRLLLSIGFQRIYFGLFVLFV